MITLEDGAYTIEVALTGGSGRADVDSPAHLTVNQGQMQAQIVWSSPYYDYMEVDGRGYAPINEEGNSVFSIAVPALDEEIAVSAETVAMSMPHTIEYTLRFDSATLRREGVSPADWGMGTRCGGHGSGGHCPSGAAPGLWEVGHDGPGHAGSGGEQLPC